MLDLSILEHWFAWSRNLSSFLLVNFIDLKVSRENKRTVSYPTEYKPYPTLQKLL